MLNDWFYSHSTWEVMFVVCAAIVGLSLCVLYLFHRFVEWEPREKDTSMVGLSYALAGGIYAIVISFVAVGVYENMDKADGVATAEANYLSSVVFDSAGLPADLAQKVRGTVYAYIDTVTEKEWHSQQAYQMDDSNFAEGWSELRQLSHDLSSFEPATQGQATLKLEMLQNIDDLFGARHTRLLAANAHLPDTVWQMMVLGLMLVLVYVCLFGPHSYTMHMAVTALTMFTIGLVFTLIIAMDYPFRGDVSVSDEAYVGTRQVADSIFGKPSENPSAVTHEQK